MKQLLYGAALLALSTSANAANITGGDFFGGYLIGIEGPIETGDFAKFKRIADQSHNSLTSVALASPGGIVVEALQIGTYIRLRGWDTAAVGECDSACANIWLAGVRRGVSVGARVGFHAASLNGVEKGAGNAIVGAYLNRLGLSDEAIFWATSAPPSGIDYLTPAKAKELDIAVEWPTETAAVPASRPLEPTPRPPSAPMSACDALADYPQFSSDCDPDIAGGFVAIRTWDEHTDMTVIRRTLQHSAAAPALYRVFKVETDASGTMVGGSLCYFGSYPWSDCQSTESEDRHFSLTPNGLSTPRPAKPKVVADNCDVCPGRTCKPCYWRKHPPQCEYGRKPGTVYCNRVPN